MEAVLLVSHGSRSARSREEIDALAKRLAGSSGAPIFESAFLEIEQPSIPQGLEACRKRGATRITVLLNFLNSGRHVVEDVPGIVEAFKAEHPNVVCRITPCLGAHPGLDALYLDLIRRATESSPSC